MCGQLLLSTQSRMKGLESVDSGFPFSWLFLLRDISEWLA
jgi:hypothetical protein